MNILSAIILGLTAFFLIVGALWGLKRGFLHSLVHFISVVAAFLIAWLAKPLYVSLLMDIKISDHSLKEWAEGLFGGGEGIGSVIVPLAEILLGVLLFMLVFAILKFFFSIACFIIGFYLPKQNKRRLLGVLFGVLQGLVFTFAICGPLNGLILDANKLMTVEVDGEPILSADVREDMKESGFGLDEYADGVVAKIYSAVGGGFYRSIASTKNANGEKVTFSGYVDATVATTKFVEEFANLGDINFDNGLTPETRDSIEQVFKNLDQIKGEMSDEAKTTVNDLISIVVEEAGGEMPPEVQNVLEGFDIEEVNFEKEGEIILKLYDYAEEENSEVTATEIVNSLAESTVILPAIESIVSADQPIELPDEATKAEVAAAINSLTDANAAASLRKIFGLTN